MLDIKVEVELKEEPPAPKEKMLDIVFDGPPSHESGRFVEVEVDGKGVGVGAWVHRPDGYWTLRFSKKDIVDVLSF